MDLVEDTLVIGVGVDSVHQATLDAKGVVQNFSGRSEAVCRAGSVGNNVMFGGIILVFVDTKHDSDIFAFGGSGDDNLLRASLEMGCCLIGIGKETGRLDDQIDT